MMKRVLSLILCVLMLVTVLASCANNEINEENKGAHITMYLTDMVYDLDPANAYANESALKVVGLLFDNLFVLDEDGKVKKSLAKDYEIIEDDNAEEYKMIITIKDTAWSDGVNVSANDVVYSWKRLLDVSNSYSAASLLYDIKNARLAKEGELSIDDVRIYALNEKQLEIQFEGKIDYDQFLIKLTSYALAPLREDVVKKTDDWAKKPATIVTSGPFRLREVSYVPEEAYLLLERNIYYCRDINKDKLAKSVTPYRILVDYTKTDEEIMAAWENGDIFYVGDIPLSCRADYATTATVTNALSTHSYFINENAVVRYYNAVDFEKLTATPKEKQGNKLVDVVLEDGVDGEKIFAIDDVREAMSLAIDREAIAEAIIFADAATGLVPYGVFNTTAPKESFRDATDPIINTAADSSAKSLLEAALAEINHTPADFMFTISVAAYDDVHVKIAEMVAGYWTDLGFNVKIEAIDVIVNDDPYLYDQAPGTSNSKEEEEYIPEDIMDDIWAENFRAGKYEVAALDFTAFSADAYSVLAQFAKGFTGRASVIPNSLDYTIPAHITGLDCEEYNKKIDEAFAEKDVTKQSVILHEAEKILVEDAHIIPIIFNKNAVLVSEDLSKYEFTYYGTGIFNKMKQKDYELYVPAEE